MVKPILIVGLSEDLTGEERESWFTSLDYEGLKGYIVLIYQHPDINKPEFQLLPEKAEIPENLLAVLQNKEIVWLTTPK